MTPEELDLQNALVQNGIVGYDRSDIKYLANVARICARTSGLAMAGVGGVALAGAGSVTIPGIGAVPGYVAGALAGFIGGTATCMIGRGSLKRGLDQILDLRK